MDPCVVAGSDRNRRVANARGDFSKMSPRPICVASLSREEKPDDKTRDDDFHVINEWRLIDWE